MSGDEDEGKSGVLVGSPAPLFENLDDDDALLQDSSPFKIMPRGGSRKGRPNKRTQAMRDLYLRMGLPHPMLWQGQVLGMKVEDLARELMCTRIEAAELQRKVAADLGPYLESKMPARVDLGEGDALPVLVVRDLDAPRGVREARAAGAISIDDDLADALERDEEKQRLSASGPGASHGEPSHDEAKGET